MSSTTMSDPRPTVRILRSGIARRIFLSFVLAALVPLLLFAGYSLDKVASQLELQAVTHLRESCKAAGMTIAERLGHLRGDLSLMAGTGLGEGTGRLQDAPHSLRLRFETRFHWVAVATPDAEVLDELGTGVELPELSEEEREHLEDRSVLALFRPRENEPPAVIMAVALEDASEGLYAFGEVRSTYLWGGEGVVKPNTDVVVFTEAGELVFATGHWPELNAALTAALKVEAASGDLDWQSDGASHIASYRTMFVSPRFFNDFILAHSLPRELVLAPIHTYKTTFGLFGLLTFFAVVLISMVQIRRSLVPIVLLQDGTSRLAEGLSESRVTIDTNDEFGDLARSFNAMADRISERTVELERANRAKADFLANMSHEIRTPMTAVLGYSEMALSEDLSSEDRDHYLSVIFDSSKHLLDVVDQILDVSSVEAGQMRIRNELCSPCEILGDVSSLLKAEAREKNLDLVFTQEVLETTRVHTDRTRFRQILINVIGNAIKFTEKGSVQVRAFWQQAGDGRSLLAVRVRDTGPGIATEELESIFTPFFQADTSMSRRYGGTGLGLSVARSMARLLGGDVTCLSQLRHGSTFTITLDPGEVTEVEPSVVATVEPEPADPKPEPGSSDEGTDRILFAEDALATRRLISTILRKAGLEVDEAENGRIAFELATAAREAGQPYGLILMDMQMPEMDGYEATSKLRELGYRGDIVALTAHSVHGERERCLAAGCDEFATKPIPKAELIELAGRYVNLPPKS